MAVVVDDILKIVWQAKVAGIGTRIQNVYYYQVSTLVDGDEANVSLDWAGLMPILYANIGDWFSIDYVLEHLRITNDTQKTFVGQPTPVFVGGAAANTSSPAQVAVEVLGRAQALGHTARKYIGPVIEAAHTDGVLVALALVDFNVFADSYSDGALGGTTGNLYLPVMVKHAVGGAIDSFLFLDENLHSVIPTARTQRRRIPGRGLS